MIQWHTSAVFKTNIKTTEKILLILKWQLQQTLKYIFFCAQ